MGDQRVGRFWSLFFGLHALLGLALCLAAPSLGWWFPVAPQAPAGEPLSPIGKQIDGLFFLILGLSLLFTSARTLS